MRHRGNALEFKMTINLTLPVRRTSYHTYYLLAVSSRLATYAGHVGGQEVSYLTL
jgi:hypothetical protein